MAYADDLIEQANQLLGVDRHRPKQASLRRAVSAAYYALFHAVVERAAACVLSNADAAGLVGFRLRRVVHHRNVLQAAKWFAGSLGNVPPAIQAMRSLPPATAPGIEPVLSRLCKLFTELQSERHRADYDLAAPFSRAETARRIADAEAAIGDLAALDARGDALIFFLGCILGDGLTKNS